MRRFTPQLAVPLILVAMNATTLVADWNHGRAASSRIGAVSMVPAGFFRTNIPRPAPAPTRSVGPATTLPCENGLPEAGSPSTSAMHSALLVCRPDAAGNPLPFRAI